ncbi:hypothetical protein FOZ62_013618, partial [Perkinsus olseni]
MTIESNSDRALSRRKRTAGTIVAEGSVRETALEGNVIGCVTPLRASLDERPRPDMRMALKEDGGIKSGQSRSKKWLTEASRGSRDLVGAVGRRLESENRGSRKIERGLDQRRRERRDRRKGLGRGLDSAMGGLAAGFVEGALGFSGAERRPELGRELCKAQARGELGWREQVRKVSHQLLTGLRGWGKAHLLEGLSGLLKWEESR